ncbi:HEPN domain-containing protein [Prevotella sp. AGR2160]|jgi:hypothetical protein|uniref:ApeA N-terminal domain 1-containing protein n=1 Tax=Prevotella sp. AGR2160 TaxID=1280674 RepID=UPI000563F877|nr:HEPN domain-containing protein [Prevotella sp. AGR2160]
MADISFDNDFTIEGFWHLPESNHEVYGLLHHKVGDHMLLHVVGSISKRTNFDLTRNSESFDTLYGKSLDGKLFTIYGCVFKEQRKTGDNAPSVDYICSCLLQGLNIKKESVLIKRANVNISGLSTWCPPDSKEDLIRELNFDAIGKAQIEYRYKPNEICNVKINDQLDISLGYNVIEKNSIHDDLLFSVDYRTSVSFLNNGTVTLAKQLDNIFLFQQFLSFGMAQECHTKEIQCYLSIEESSGEPIYIVTGERHTLEHEYSYTPILFTYKSLGEHFRIFLSNWYNISNELKPIRDFLVDSILSKEKSETVKFLNLAIAVESYYLRFVGDDKYKDIIDKLVNAFHDVNKLAKDKINSEEIRDTRHYFAHYLKTPKNHTVSGMQMSEQAWYLRKLLICCVLSSCLQTKDNKIINSILDKSNCWYLEDWDKVHI